MSAFVLGEISEICLAAASWGGGFDKLVKRQVLSLLEPGRYGVSGGGEDKEEAGGQIQPPHRRTPNWVRPLCW